MESQLFNRLSYSKLFKETQNIEINREEEDIISYPYFIRFFEEENLSIDTIIIGFNLIKCSSYYKISLNLANIDKIVPILEAAKNDKQVSLDDINKLATITSNSLVAISKLLHYIKPNKYATWDLSTFQYLTGSSSTYGIDQPTLYFEYLDKLHQIASESTFHELHQLMISKLGYDVSKFRAIQLSMALSAKRVKKTVKLI